jgi:hypothetical protein
MTANGGLPEFPRAMASAQIAIASSTVSNCKLRPLRELYRWYNRTSLTLPRRSAPLAA